MSKIELNDDGKSIMIKMSEGNPGAIAAMIVMVVESDSIDPKAFMGGIGAIIMLDTWKIYGTDIHILFNDKCDRDVRKMLVLIRAVQLGFFSQVKLQEMAADQRREINISDDEWQEIDDKVCGRLVDFQKRNEEVKQEF